MRAFLVSLCLVLVGCGAPAATHPTRPVSPWSAPAFFADIPTDTPYVFASIDPMNEALRMRVMKSIGERLSKSLAVYDALVKDEDEPWKRAVATLIDALRGTNLDKWNETIGLAPSPRMALYGLGIYPVLRIEVADAAKLRALATKVIAAAGGLQSATLGGVQYWTHDKGKGVTFVFSILDTEAVAAILPTPQLAQLLPMALGLAHPPHTLADTMDVPQAMQKYGFNRSMFVEVDTAHLGAALATIPESPVASQACQDDFTRLASYVPRMLMGYRHLDGDGFALGFVLETSPAIADALARVQTAMPQLPRDGAPLFELAAGVDVDALVGVVRAGVHELRNQPFQCPAFAGAADHLDRLAQALDTPLPEQVHGFRGVDFVVDDYTPDPLMAKGAVVVLGAPAHAMLSSMLAKIAMPQVPDDGSPVELPLGTTLAPLGFGAVAGYAVARPDAAALAIGDAAHGDGIKDRVVKALATAPDPHGPLASLTWDLARTIAIAPAAFGGNSQAAVMRSMKRVDVSVELKGHAIDLEFDAGWP